METLQSENIFGLEKGQALLGVNAHPDDFEMFNSALAEQALEQGVNLVTATATAGEATTLNFKDPGRPISEIRGEEASRAFEEQGIAEDRREFYGLPDGKLHKPLNRLRLGWKIARTILKHDVSAIVTPGAEGVDGHRDHRAVHRAAVAAARLLRLTGREITIWAAVTDDAYDAAVNVNPSRKKELVHIHASQFPKNRPEFFEPYEQMLKQERYVRVL